MVLSKNEILRRCIHENLIEGFEPLNIQSCSYDLRMGNQYYYHDKKDKGPNPNIRYLKVKEKLKIPPNAICYVITEEKVNMPNDLTASISLSFGLISRGVMLAVQPPYDPGYRGKTVAMLHNLSNQEIVIQRGQHILNIVFSELDKRVDEDQLYNGKHQHLNNLADYCQDVRVGAIFKMNQELKKGRTRFNNAVPTILTILTVLISLITLIYFPGIVSWIPGCSRIDDSNSQESMNNASTQEQENSIYEQMIVDKENNTISFFFDNQYYQIPIKNSYDNNLKNVLGEQNDN